MYFTLLCGFSHYEADAFQNKFIPSDNVWRFETLINQYPSKLEYATKIVINTDIYDFSSQLTHILCQFPYKGMLKYISFIDSNKIDERHDLYTIRQGLTKLDEKVIRNYSNIYHLSYLLYSIDPR